MPGREFPELDFLFKRLGLSRREALIVLPFVLLLLPSAGIVIYAKLFNPPRQEMRLQVGREIVLNLDEPLSQQARKVALSCLRNYGFDDLALDAMPEHVGEFLVIKGKAKKLDGTIQWADLTCQMDEWSDGRHWTVLLLQADGEVIADLASQNIKH